MAQTKRARSAAPQHKREPRPLVGREEKPEPEQITAPDLQGDNPVAAMPSTIVNDRMAVAFVKPHFEISKDERSVGLDISLELTDAHTKVLSEPIIQAWKIIKGGNFKRLDLNESEVCYVNLSMDPVENPNELYGQNLELKAATVSKVSLSVIEEKGSGEVIEVIRLSFRVITDISPDVERFACRQYGKTVWLKMAPLQGKLL